MSGELTGYKGVWVFAEQREGKLMNVTLELLGKAGEFAREEGVKLTAILLGSGVERLAPELIYHGAGEVILVDSPVLAKYSTIPYATALADLVNEYKPSIFLFGATALGRDLAPRVMAKLKTGLTADCLDLQLDEKGLLVQTKPSYGGNVMCKIVCPKRRPQMATVRPKVFPIPARDESRRGSIIKKDLQVREDERYRITGSKPEMPESKIEEADIIVVGGRGLEKKENLALIQELAEVLGGSVGCTRPLADEGWLPAFCQIGQSGKTVKPKLIIACGVSGAVQFNAGIQGSDCIVAINRDPNAPIFSIANYGITGNVEEVLPVLIRKFKECLKK